MDKIHTTSMGSRLYFNILTCLFPVSFIFFMTHYVLGSILDTHSWDYGAFGGLVFYGFLALCMVALFQYLCGYYVVKDNSLEFIVFGIPVSKTDLTLSEIYVRKSQDTGELLLEIEPDKKKVQIRAKDHEFLGLMDALSRDRNILVDASVDDFQAIFPREPKKTARREAIDRIFGLFISIAMSIFLYYCGYYILGGLMLGAAYVHTASTIPYLANLAASGSNPKVRISLNSETVTLSNDMGFSDRANFSDFDRNMIGTSRDLLDAIVRRFGVHWIDFMRSLRPEAHQYLHGVIFALFVAYKNRADEAEP